MKRTFFFGMLIALLIAKDPDGQITAQAPAVGARTGAAVLDDWGDRFRLLGTLVPENPLRTQVRTTIAQLARGGQPSNDWFIGFNISRKFF